MGGDGSDESGRRPAASADPWVPHDGGFRREHLTEERMAALARLAAEQTDLVALSEGEREASRRALLAGLGRGSGVWVFGYGSLMWNPAMRVAERQFATVHGFHRSFCLWTPLGRGSPDNPGMVLGLKPGGSCNGVALRLAPEAVEEETRILWRREMFAGVYRPRWLRARLARRTVAAIAFTIDRSHERYAGAVPVERMVRALATASGRLGSSYDYLASTVAHLDELGVRDGAMHRLLRRVEGYRRGSP